MGTIAQRKRADGTTAYTAQIRLKDQGVIVHTQAQTFTKKALAQAWLKRREAELQVARATGVLNQKKLTVGDLLNSYAKQTKGITEVGDSKTAGIKRLTESGPAEKDAHMLAETGIPVGRGNVWNYAASDRSRVRQGGFATDQGDFKAAAEKNVKHPTQKKGNRRKFRILSAAMEIIDRQPRIADQVFPYRCRSARREFAPSRFGRRPFSCQ